MTDSIFKYIVGRVSLFGTTPKGLIKSVPVSGEGFLKTVLMGPKLPFGAIHTEGITPIFQSDAVYGLNTQQMLSRTSGTGAVAVENSSWKVSTGATVNSLASVQSRKRLRYRAGQGTVGRFAGLFTTPVPNSYQVMGIGHSEDGFYVGYKGTDFGILHNFRGVRETQTLTITNASTNNENVTVTLDGTAFTVAVTNSASTLRTAWEISQGTYSGWDAEAVGSTVVFVAQSAGNKTGGFTLAGTSAAGTFAETKAGVAASENFVKQSDWNGDRLDGTGPSGVIADWTKGNVFQIKMQYLGFGSIVFEAEVNDANNYPEFVVLHVIRNPNTLTDTHVGNPSFPFTMSVLSTGSTSNLSVKCGSVAGMIEGDAYLHGPMFTFSNILTTVGATNYQALFTIRNTRYFGGRTNQAVIYLLSISAAIKHTSPCIFYIIRNGALSGNPSFSQYSANSCSYYDTSATTVAVTTNDQIIWTGHIGDTGNIVYTFSGSHIERTTLQPGEWITLACKATTGTPSYVTGSLNIREDQ